MSSLLCRDNKAGNIVMKNTRLGLYRESFIFRGSVMWNELSKELKDEKKIGNIKKGLKKWVMPSISRFLG